MNYCIDKNVSGKNFDKSNDLSHWQKNFGYFSCQGGGKFSNR